MPSIELTPAQCREQRAHAHRLAPVLLIASDGLMPAVVWQIDAALKAHGLIKVRVFNDDRAARERMYQQLTADLTAAPVQHIGKLLAIWRPPAVKEAGVDK